MQKFIRITAIIAAVLVGLSFLLLLGTLPFQRLIARGLLNYPEDILSCLPQVPLITLITTFLQLGCMILLIVACSMKKNNILLEILVFASLAALLPTLSNLLEPMYRTFVGNFRGYNYIAAQNVATQIANFCRYPAELGIALGYGVCGMSLVYKRMNKKLAKVTE